MKSSENEENTQKSELKFLKNLHQWGRIGIFSYSLPGLMLFLYFVPSDLSCARVVCCVSSLFSDMITLRGQKTWLVVCYRDSGRHLLKRMWQPFCCYFLIHPGGKCPCSDIMKKTRPHTMCCAPQCQRGGTVDRGTAGDSTPSSSFLHCTKVQLLLPFLGL